MSSATAMSPAGVVRDLRTELESLASTTWDSIAGERSRARLTQAVRSPGAHVLGWFAAVGGPLGESARADASADGMSRPGREAHGWDVVDRELTRC